MADIDNSLVLHDLRKESIVRELMEKTKNGGITWSSLSSTEFQTAVVAEDLVTVWTFYIAKTQIGNLTYKYNLDIKRNNASFITLADGPLPSSSRDSQTKNLYETIEMLTLQLDQRAEEALRTIQDIVSCAES